jgi:hypothetical protein
MVGNVAFPPAHAGTLFGEWAGDMASEVVEISAAGMGQLPDS